MKETSLYSRITKTLGRHGAVLRIENVSGASLPDIAWLTNGITVWIEAKLRIGHQVHFNKFQLSLARLALQHLPSWQWLCVVQNAELVHVYRFDQFLDRANYARSSKIVTVKITEIDPWCELYELPNLVMQQTHVLSAIKAELHGTGS